VPRENFEVLDALEPGQQVVLKIDGVTGTWKRSGAYQHRNSPSLYYAPTLEPADQETEQHWSGIPKYAKVEIELVSKGPVAEARNQAEQS
jgi:hypothetical protein